MCRKFVTTFLFVIKTFKSTNTQTLTENLKYEYTENSE